VSTLPRSTGQPVYLPSGGPTTVAKVTRSRSLSSRPAGVAVFHTPGRMESRSAIDIHNDHSRPATRMSSKSRRSHMTGVTGVSGATSSPGKSTTKAGVVIETMSAPNPFWYRFYMNSVSGRKLFG
jgi:hypothetical protein